MALVALAHHWSLLTQSFHRSRVTFSFLHIVLGLSRARLSLRPRLDASDMAVMVAHQCPKCGTLVTGGRPRWTILGHQSSGRLPVR